MSDPHADRLRRAVAAVRVLRERVAALEGDRAGPIAVVGMGCRLPGGAHTPAALWDLLVDGRIGTTGVPADRWPVRGWYDPTPGTPGRSYVRHGGFLRDDVFAFDPRAFGISDAEATAMDPMHRLLLEVQHEALEHAGIAPGSLGGRSVGVFVGIAHSEHKLRVHDQGPEAVDAWVGTGNTSAAAVGRLAYVLGTHGPTLAVDTACSASLVALDLAVRALRERTCDLAVVAGVNVLLDPDAFAYLCAIGALAPNGRSKPFDAAADGYGRGEGCGVLVLERDADATAAGHTVHARVLGTAVNHDGRSNGLTAPSGPAQEQVIRAALVNAGVGASDVAYVECHGTGTPLGDPIEAGALAAVYGTAPVLGAVKANIGHLEAAAGVAGALKAVLALRHGMVPPQPSFGEPSAHLRPGTRIANAPTPFTGLAATSAFGIGGTNAHAILGPGAPSSPSPDGVAWLPLSARTPAALDALRQAWGDRLSDGWTDLAHTARVGRDAHRHRLSVVAGSAAEARTALAEAEPSVSAEPRVAFAFTGQGAQHARMGLDLADAFPVFAAALDRCARVLDPLLPMPLHALLADGDALNHTANTQPALFAVGWALAELWRSWGVEPDAVIGHSIGEWVAAVVAGVVTLDDALEAVVVRGRLMGGLPTGGAMAAVLAPEAAVRPHLGDGVDVAAINHPGETVISGDADAVDATLAHLGDARLLRVSHAFHSHRMDPALAPFAAHLDAVALRPPRLPFPSNRTGALESEAWTAPEHWAGAIRAPVRFAACLRALDVDVVLELGPRAVLAGFVGQTLDIPAVPSQRRGVEPVRAVLGAAAALWGLGVPVERGATGHGQIVEAPLTPWDRRHLSIAPVARPDDTYRVEWVPAAAGRSPAGAAVHGSGTLADQLRQQIPAGTGVVWVDPGGAAIDRCDALRTALQEAADRPGPTHVWVVTQDAWTDPDAAALGGLVRCAALELPQLRPTLIDLAPQADPALIPALLGLDEREWRLDADGPRVSRLVRHRTPVTPAVVGGTWAITGGTGALGLALAERLAAHGVHTLRLASRSGTADPARLAALRAHGAAVTTHALDVSDAPAVAALVDGCDGVAHAAGALADITVLRLTRAHLDRALSGKLGGALLLDRLVPDAVPLVLYSSMAGVTGSPGQAAYAAANAALDAVARRRVARGGRALSVAWGPWSGGGMAADTLDRRSAQGIAPLDPDTALDRLEQLLADDAPAVVVADVDWSAARDATDLPPLVAGLAPHAAPQTGDLRSRIELAVARSLGLEPPIPSDRGLAELGMDSLQALELATALGRLSDARVARTVAWDHPTLDALVAHLGGATAPTASGSTAPAAIVGWACRLPGIDHPLSLWERWTAHRPTVGSTDRWDPDDHPTVPAAHGGFLADPALFDPAFFGISPREAATLDPQQRLLLELTWEAMADAGLSPDDWRGRRVGVFVGTGPSDYALLLDRAGQLGTALYAGSGNDPSFTAGRIAYTFGFTGPSLAVQAACPSALVAAHLARQALAAGECELAVVAGVHLSLIAEPFADAAAGGALSPDGHTRSFLASADGYGRSEGAAVLLLAPDDAGLPVRARLLGTAVGHGGRTASLTAPSGTPQSAAIRAALGDLDPASIGYIEGHGTASTQGDAIEIGALAACYPSAVLSSVKSIVGNTEAASGAVGLLAAALVLHHGEVPGQPSDACDALADTGLRLPVGPTSIRGRVAVNAYGLSGTAAHALLGPGDAPPAPPVPLPFNRVRCWFDADTVPGRLVDSPLLTWERRLRPDPDHTVLGTPRVSAATWIRWALAAGDGRALADVVFIAPVDLLHPRRARLTVLPDGGWQIAVRAGRWSPVATGRFIDATPSVPPTAPSTPASHDALYAAFAAGGQGFGPGYRALVDLRVGDGAAAARLTGGSPEGRWDAGLQLRAAVEAPGAMFVPAAIDWVGGDPAGADRVVLAVREADPDSWVSAAWWLDGDRVVAWTEGQVSRRVTAEGRRLVASGGDLGALSWAAIAPRSPGPGEVAIAVDASGLNFRDVLQALDVVGDGSTALGAECVGRVVAVGADVDLSVGDRVLAFGAGALATHVVVPAAGAARTTLPDAIAATTPVAWLTAWVALHHVARLQPGERVLIHSAAGGVGLAATRVAHSLGAEVWGTAHPRKHHILRAEGVSRTASSRDLAFSDTFSDGADVVLNGLIGPFIDASLGLLRPGGRFIELGKRDLRALPAPRYQRFDLGTWADADPAALSVALAHVLSQVGVGWAPLPVRSFGFDAATEAFRHLAAAAHIGKVALIRRTVSTTHRAVVPLPTDRRGVRARVLAEVRAVLGLDADPPADRPLRDLGLDSLASIELRNRLARAAGRNLPATLVFSAPTVDALATALAPAIAEPDPIDETDSHIDADADALLAELDAELAGLD
ncbi:MAG: acyl transferase domain-containing protein/NADPH:quinone reductase-like Zn-dependent oxidoreductase [Myxococcota bacterium]|jgi:acyl transferase domain-containing protein/NADPH:quinone reductase-like Zn-dependent oxidoreductase/acyl carrier protein